MNKWLKIGLGAILVLIVLGIAAGPSNKTGTNQSADQTQTPAQSQLTPSSSIESNIVSTVNEFHGVVEGDVIRFYFQVQDPTGYNTTADGKADVVLEDSSGNALFSQSFDVRKSDFVDYKVVLTGADLTH